MVRPPQTPIRRARKLAISTMKRSVAKARADKRDLDPTQKSTSNDEVEFIVEVQDDNAQSAAQAVEGREPNEDCQGTTTTSVRLSGGVEQREELAVDTSLASPSSGRSEKTPKAEVTPTRRARMRANRILKFAPLRFRAGLAQAASSPSNKNETTQAESPKVEAKPSPVAKESEPLPSVISIDKSNTQEESFVNLFGKQNLSLREPSLDRRILALERHLEQVSDDDSLEEALGKMSPKGNVKGIARMRSTASSAFKNIPNHDLTDFERLALKRSKQSFTKEEPVAPITSPRVVSLQSWLAADHGDEADESTDDSDEESHDTFHSFLVNHPKNKFASRRDDFSDNDDYGSHTSGSYDDENSTLERSSFGSETDTDGSYTDGERSARRSIHSFTSGEYEDETDVDSRTDGSYTEGSATDGSFTDESQAIEQTLSDPDPFSQIEVEEEDEEEAGNGTDASTDMFQYKKGRFLIVI